LSAFQPDINGPADPGGKLDLKAIEAITVLDVGGEAGMNKITIRDLRMVKR
jgi:hypothetical protein